MNLEQDIQQFLARGGQITVVPRGVMKSAPEVVGSWQDESQRHRFSVRQNRDAYKPITNDDGEPEV
jgi:hypothetical protein